jgi:hypothetical protein
MAAAMGRPLLMQAFENLLDKIGAAGGSFDPSAAQQARRVDGKMTTRNKMDGTTDYPVLSDQVTRHIWKSHKPLCPLAHLRLSQRDLVKTRQLGENYTRSPQLGVSIGPAGD